jgi:TonB-dependent receptor
VRSNFTWARSEALSFRVGAAYDDVARRIEAFDNTRAWQNAVCGGNPNQFIDAPNGQPGCNGFAAGDPRLITDNPQFPGLGTGATVGAPPLVYQGSLIPNSSAPSYLYPGPDGFVTVDWERFKADSQYDRFHSETRLGGSSNTQARTGLVQEKIGGAYLELSGDTTIGENRLRYTAGIRRVRTDQTIEGRQERPDPRNFVGGVQIADGSRYPAVVTFPNEKSTYFNTLPAFEVAYNVSESTVVRGAASKTMTRPDPSLMLPGIDFSGTAADNASLGNTSLDPFESENIDIGFEHYTGQEGYFGVAAFRKRVTGFTVQQITNVPFTDLAQFGITFDTINSIQQTAINSRGGPNVARVNLTETVNASGALTVNGLEFNWVQPLDALLGRWGLDGLGFASNLTLINQSGKGAAPAVAINVAPHTYNNTLYYEKGGISARLSQTFTKGSQSSVPNQQNVTLAALFGDDYEQWDFSSSVDLSDIFGWETDIQVTLDAVNLFQQKQRSYLQFENAPHTVYYPGRQYMVGFRGRF